MQGVVGFLMGGLTWFAVPFVFATTMGMAYLAIKEHRGPLLNEDEVNEGELFASHWSDKLC